MARTYFCIALPSQVQVVLMTDAAHADPQLDIAILGGGLAGLSCALALRHTGLRVALFERATTLGGRASSWIDRCTGDAIDIGPHIFLSEYRNLLDILKSLGTAHAIAWQTDRFVTLLDGNRRRAMRVSPLPAPLHLLPSLLGVDSLSLTDKVSNARITLLALRMRRADFERFDQVSAEELLRACGVTRRFRDWFWATAVLALLNVPLEKCSATALLRMYAHLIETNGYRSGFASRPLADLFVPPAEQALRRSGVAIEPGIKAMALRLENGRVRGLQLSDGRNLSIGACVAALPPHDLAQLLAASGIDDARWRRIRDVFQPCPYISTHLWLDRKITREKFWSRVWSEDDLNSDFYDLSNIRTDLDPKRSLVASNCIFSVGREHLSDREIIERSYRELCDFAPLATQAHVRHAEVNRIPMAITCPRPGTETTRPSTVTDIGGLLLAGDWTHTSLPSCMESAAYSGRLAAERVLERAGRPESLAISPPQGGTVVRLLHKVWPATGATIARSIERSSARNPC